MSRYIVWSIAAVALVVAVIVLEPFFFSQTASTGRPGRVSPVKRRRFSRCGTIAARRFRSIDIADESC